MKKALSTVVSATLAVSMLAGCGQAASTASSTDGSTGTNDTAATSTASGEKTKLLLWMPPFGTEDTLDKELWQDILQPFEEENNCEVSIEIIPWANYEEKYLTAISAGEGPDVGYMYMEMMSDYIDMGALESFDSYLTDADKSNFLYLDKGVINGQQYAMPIVVGSARVMYYNKDLLDASGITKAPKTWEDFTAACNAVNATGVTPFQMQWGDASKGAMNAIFFPYLWQAGGQIFSEDGTTATFNSEAGIKAAQFVYGLKEEGILPGSTTSMTEDQVFSLFKDGKLAFCVGPTNKGDEFTTAGINWDYTTSLTETTGGTFAAADSLVLLSGSKNKELAAKMALYMLSGDSMSKFHEMSPFPPVGKDEEYHDNETFKRVYTDDADSLVTLPAVKGSAAIYDNLYKNLQLMMLGELSPEDALNQSADYANEALAQN